MSNPQRGTICPMVFNACNPECKWYLKDGECAMVVMAELNALLLEKLNDLSLKTNQTIPDTPPDGCEEGDCKL